MRNCAIIHLKQLIIMAFVLDITTVRRLTNKILIKVEVKKKELLTVENQLYHVANEMANYIVSLLPPLRELVVNNTFSNSNDEIEFFKLLKPQIIKELLYFIDVYNIERDNTRTSHEHEISYYKSWIQQIHTSFTIDNHLKGYFDLGRSERDIEYFTRFQSNALYHTNSIECMQDPGFSTFHDKNYANYLARKNTLFYLKNRILTLESIQNLEKNNPGPVAGVRWNGSKSDLIQVIYGLYIAQRNNKNKISLLNVTRLFEIFFHIKFSNINVSIHQLKNAKKDRFPFIKRMLTMLNSDKD